MGAAERGARPVPDDRRRDRERAAARTESCARRRQLDGRSDQRARGAAGRGAHRRGALDVRNRRRRDPSQQLPARRRVRDGEAAGDDAGPARELLPELQRGHRHRVRAAGDREPGADDAAGPCPARARDGVPERDAGRARLSRRRRSGTRMRSRRRSSRASSRAASRSSRSSTRRGRGSRCRRAGTRRGRRARTSRCSSRTRPTRSPSRGSTRRQGSTCSRISRR